MSDSSNFRVFELDNRSQFHHFTGHLSNFEYTRYVGNVEVGARVNTRNSIKSIFRTPVKSGLFLLLIAAVTAFLYLSINTWFASAAMLRDAEDVYTTIVTFKFRDTYGSSEGYKTPEMEADAAKIDFEAMATNENMLLWQPSNVTFGSAQGFLSGSRDREYAFSNVFIVTGLRQYSDGGQYVGTLVDTLYSFREYEPGRFIFFNGDFSAIDDHVKRGVLGHVMPLCLRRLLDQISEAALNSAVPRVLRTAVPFLRPARHRAWHRLPSGWPSFRHR